MQPSATLTPQTSPRSPLFVVVPALVVGVLLVGMVRRAARPIDDPDAWWHLRVGSLFWDGTFSLTRTGPLSSFATEPWVPRDWIPQLAASKLEQWFGLPGVAWLYGASLVVFLVVVYSVARRQATSLLAALVTALGVVGAYGSTTERPQMVSFILLAVVTDAWLRISVDHEWRWWLIPLTWVWASSHGLWYVGVAIGVVTVLGLILDGSADRRTCLRLATLPLLSTVAAGITPAGPALLLAAFQTGDKWKFVSEWAAPQFTSPSPAAAMLMVCLVALTWARRRAAATWVTIGLLLLGTALILMAARTVAAGAVILVPVLAATLQSAVYGAPPADGSRREGRALLGAGATTLAALALITPVTSVEPGAVPSSFDNRLADLPTSTTVLNDYALGGWFHWRHPALNTVIDGFTDGYRVQALEGYTSALSAEPGWEEYVADTGARVAVLEEDSPLAFALTNHLDWVELARDEGFAYLTAPTP